MIRRFFSPRAASFLILALALAIPYGCSSRPSGGNAAEPVKITELTDLPGRPVTRGEKLYAHYCAFCHGKEGRGDGLNAFNLSAAPRDFTDAKAISAKTDEQLADIIATGGKASGFAMEMPAFGSTLSRSQILDLVRNIRTLAAKAQDDSDEDESR